ncbi:MAG: hypothetical protein ACKVOP_13105 [Sphingomonadaceae bacterium]
MDDPRPMVTKKKRRISGRVVRRALLAIFAILIVAIVDLSPRVEATRAPAAIEAERARDLVRTLRSGLKSGNGTTSIRATREDLTGAATLASWLGRFGRFDAAIREGRLVLRGSKALGPIWLNVDAKVSASAAGFPDVALTVGDLPLGTTLSRALFESGRWVLRVRGAAVPPLDTLVRSVRIEPAAVSARIHFPLRSGLADQLTGVNDRPIDPALTTQIFCRLIAANRVQPTDALATVVRRAFHPIRSDLPEIERHRAAFAAVAIYTVGRSAGRLAGNAGERVASCGAPHAPPVLGGRVDLAAHWALSAALSAAFGDDVSKALGEFKELADSRPSGSGFSFVDLAADRSGLAVARAALDPASAPTTVSRLRRARDEDLLPLRALALAEGLTEAEFVGRFGAIDSAEFARAKDRIDAILSDSVGG